MRLVSFEVPTALGHFERLGPTKTKDFEISEVFDPCRVTADELHGVDNLRMTTMFNGEARLDGPFTYNALTSAECIAYVSRDEYWGWALVNSVMRESCAHDARLCAAPAALSSSAPLPS
jgi:hypothetical protein